jgi:hypothetical protein
MHLSLVVQHDKMSPSKLKAVVMAPPAAEFHYPGPCRVRGQQQKASASFDSAISIRQLLVVPCSPRWQNPPLAWFAHAWASCAGVVCQTECLGGGKRNFLPQDREVNPKVYGKCRSYRKPEATWNSSVTVTSHRPHTGKSQVRYISTKI